MTHIRLTITDIKGLIVQTDKDIKSGSSNSRSNQEKRRSRITKGRDPRTTLRVVQTQAILFLKSMSERVGSDIQRRWNWISRSTPYRLKMALCNNKMALVWTILNLRYQHYRGYPYSMFGWIYIWWLLWKCRFGLNWQFGWE